MRIGQFSDTFLPVVDGVGRVVYSYANTLCAKGHECYVVTPTADMGYRGGYPFEIVDFIGAPVPGSPQYKAGVSLLDPHYHERMKEKRFDIIHAHTPFIAGLQGLYYAARQGVPVVGTFHSKYYDDFYNATGMSLLANIGVKYVVEFYERCDEVWAVSAASAQVLEEYGYKGELKVMENGSDISAPREESLKLAVDRFGLFGDDPVLLFVGQQNWKKNILATLTSAAILKNRGHKFRLVMAGQGPDLEAIKAKAQELGIADITIFTGHITDNSLLNGVYQRASLFVFPSLYDTSGLVVREAAVMGTPCVVVKGSCAAEEIVDGENGLLTEDDPECLANVIEKGLVDRPMLERLGVAARDSIPVSWDSIMDTVLARYANLIRLNDEQRIKARRRRIGVMGELPSKQHRDEPNM